VKRFLPTANSTNPPSRKFTQLSRFSCFSRALLAAGVLCAAPAWAETLAYPGDFPPLSLQTVDTAANSLAPAGSADPQRKSDSRSGNRVTLDSGTVAGMVAGAVNFVDGDPVTGNEVFIKGGVAQNTVYGGVAITSLYSTTASDNHVTISGGTVSAANIFGGYATSNSAAATITASGNIITISGTPVFGASTRICGGCVQGAGSHVTADNTLHFHSEGLSAGKLTGFQDLNFYLPATLATGGTALTVPQGADIPGATVQVALEGAGPTLTPGDTFILIDASASTLTGPIDPASASGTLDGYSYTLAINGNKLVLTLGACALPGGCMAPISLPDATAIPTLNPWALLLLAGLLGAMEARVRRRG
jgi:hypothetical protein